MLASVCGTHCLLLMISLLWAGTGLHLRMTKHPLRTKFPPTTWSGVSKQLMLTQREPLYICYTADIAPSLAVISKFNSLVFVVISCLYIIAIGCNEVTLFHLHQPKNTSPQRTASLLEVIELVNKKQMSSGNKAITVMCKWVTVNPQTEYCHPYTVVYLMGI